MTYSELFPADFTEWTALERVKRWISAIAIVDPREQSQGFDSDIWYNQLKLTAASLTPMPTVTFRLKVKPDLCNLTGTMHGGAIATALDDCSFTTLALTDRCAFWFKGAVSRSLNIVFIKPARVGEEVEIVVELMAAGRSLASVRCVMRRVPDGTVIATGESGITSPIREPRSEAKL